MPTAEKKSQSKPQRLGDAALDAVRDAKAGVESRLERSPYGTVAAALGIGYVLGGGVFSPLTARALGLGVRLGLRLVVLPLLTEQIVDFVANAAEAPDGALARKSGRSHNGVNPRTEI